MADAAERLAALKDIRLPALAPEALAADAVLAIAVGLVLALGLCQLLRLFFHRPATRRQVLLAALVRSRGLPRDERLHALARLLRPLADPLGLGQVDWLAALDRRFGTDFFTTGAGAGLRDGLYRRGAPVDPEVIDREVERLLRQARI